MPSVYFADSNHGLCELYKRYFSCLGWRVDTAQGAVECLELFHRRLPDVLVLDSQLSWGGADCLLAVMRESPGLGRLPVIVTCDEFSSAGFDSDSEFPDLKWLRKPFSLHSLLELVHLELVHKSLFSSPPSANRRFEMSVED